MEPTPQGDAPQRPTQATRSRLAFHHPVPPPRASPVVGKTQQGERSRWVTRTQTLPAGRRRRCLERDQPGLVRMDRQAVLAESPGQDLPNAAGVFFLGETNDEVVRIA